MDSNVDEQVSKLFDLSKIKPLNINDVRSWVLPAKSINEIKTGVEYGDRISDNIVKSIDHPENYDVTYIKNLFKSIYRYLSKGIPFDVLASGSGFAFPNVPYNNKLEGYNQLYTKQLCDDFVKQIIGFDSASKGRDGVKVFYLLGYVGSGKSTFINYILQHNSKYLISRSVILVHFEYDDIKDEVYSDESNQEYWDARIWNLFIEKVKSSFQDPKFVHLDKDQDEEDIKKIESNGDVLKRILFRYNLLVVFDGLDSLSPNKMERTNNRYILMSIMKCLRKLKSMYSNQARVQRACHVVYSLRKCTYDMPGMPKLSRRDEDDAYFLPAPKFDDVIEKIIKFISEDKQLLRDYQGQIVGIIRLASSKLEHIIKNLPNSDNRSDIFDNNYRRRLRYISSIIIVMALRISNRIQKQSQSKIHDSFFKKLEEEIVRLPDYLAFDIMVYGVNTGFNNHFSSAEEDDNLGSLCGFLDNIFCYFPFEEQNHSVNTVSVNMVLKLRTLQILYDQRDPDCEFSYLSFSRIREELSSIGMNISEVDLESTLDFLEKSLYIRSTKPYENKSKFVDSYKDELYFKCSNLGSFLLEKVIFTYSYISGVAQNSCMPDKLSEKVIYRKKSLNSHGNVFFINKKWVINIIPNIILFLRLLRYVELNNPKAEKFYIHKNMIECCRDSVGRILHAKNHRLTEDDKKLIYDKCRYFLNIYS